MAQQREQKDPKALEIESLLKSGERRKGGMTMITLHFHQPVTIVMPPETKAAIQGTLTLVPANKDQPPRS